MKLIVLILSMINVSLSVSYKCKDNDVMNNNSCWTQFSAVVGEYQNITTWLKPTQSSHSVVISDTLFAPRNRTIKLGKSWFGSGSWNKIDIRVIIKEISKSKYELQYFIDDNKLEVRFPFETDTLLQPYYGLKWNFNGLWNISTNFPCLNFTGAEQPSSFNATNATSLYNGAVSCSSFRMSGSFPLNNITDNNINKNCSCANATKSCPLTNHTQIHNLTYLCTLIKVPNSHLNSSLSNLCSMCNTSHVCQKSSDTKPVSYNTTNPCPSCNSIKPCPTCNPTKPCPGISNNATKCSASNQTKSNLVADSSSSRSCPNDTSVISNNLKNEESHAIIYVALVIMAVGALSLVAGFLQYRKALRLRKGSDYEEFQNGTLENDSGRMSYGSNLGQRMQYNELVDKDKLQRAVPESRNTRNFSISSELDAEDVYNPMIAPLSR